ncbi:hypothetical protein JRO89_XS08G0002200 [Xanthoceras sorbifolium]|uniref:Mannan endo-1,4-beta-mannosidase n=1 Tax=Xanthoceras sorbifolium TaxID=99658 RepID=A0ABQ8HMX5_9ROSI|nr:hypothetical protein JRO89_XS08G0002200 [Xanthoceras sorbifolium]
MAYFSYKKLVLFFSCVVSFAFLAQSDQPNIPYRAVNLGNWLVTEGWIEPSLFAEIPNNDLLDGNQIQLMSTKFQKYVCAESGGGTIVVANRTSASAWENFRVRSGTRLTADYSGSSWDDSDPSVFKMSIVRTLQGEYQITNGYGPDKAPQDHWNSYITDADFNFLSSHGINAVRIPVGWWIAKDPNPPKPFVGGSLQALDNAFTWAHKYGMKVIVDLHTVQGSQNGNEHSGTRDGFQEWGDSYMPDTVAIIDFLAARFEFTNFP